MADIIPFPCSQPDEDPQEIQITATIFPDGYHSLELDGIDLSSLEQRVYLARFLESLVDGLLDDDL